MREEKQSARRREIEAAAYEVLHEKGYGAASMLVIAKRAGASNETLYKWYGNKQTLFRSLVEANARDVAALLRRGGADDADPVATLEELGPALLTLLLGERAVALNRAAAADASDTGLLGAALADAGRSTVAPLIADIFETARAKGKLAFEAHDRAAEIYISLLIGDLQVRRVTGAIGPLTRAEISKRADHALALIVRLFSPAK